MGNTVQVEFNGLWFEAREEFRVTWREFTGYKDGEAKEMTFYSDYSRDPKEDAEAFAEELRESREDDHGFVKEVGDVKVHRRYVMPWTELRADHG